VSPFTDYDRARVGDDGLEMIGLEFIGLEMIGLENKKLEQRAGRCLN
jgi:hypothetical protein